jgi:hypothetical protein
MIKGLFWVAVGAVAALQSEKLFSKLRARFTPRAVTDSFLDRLNSRLESRQTGDAPAPGL